VQIPITGSMFKKDDSFNAASDAQGGDELQDSHIPVVVAVPQPLNSPEPVRATVSIIRSPATAPSHAFPYVPFKWAKGAKPSRPPRLQEGKSRAEVFVDHATSASRAHEVSFAPCYSRFGVYPV
jgi:hypothetical protein